MSGNRCAKQRACSPTAQPECSSSRGCLPTRRWRKGPPSKLASSSRRSGRSVDGSVRRRRRGNPSRLHHHGPRADIPSGRLDSPAKTNKSTCRGEEKHLKSLRSGVRLLPLESLRGTDFPLVRCFPRCPPPLARSGSPEAAVAPRRLARKDALTLATRFSDARRVSVALGVSESSVSAQSMAQDEGSYYDTFLSRGV